MHYSDPTLTLGDRVYYYPALNEFPNAQANVYAAMIVRHNGMEDPNTMRRLVDLKIFTEVGDFVKTNVQVYTHGEVFPIPEGCCTAHPEDALRNYRYPIY